MCLTAFPQAPTPLSGVLWGMDVVVVVMFAQCTVLHSGVLCHCYINILKLKQCQSVTQDQTCTLEKYTLTQNIYSATSLANLHTTMRTPHSIHWQTFGTAQCLLPPSWEALPWSGKYVSLTD